MRKYKQAIHKSQIVQKIKIENWNIGSLIYLPCVTGILKIDSRPIVFVQVDGKGRGSAFIGDWLLEDVCGNWHVMTDEEYQKHKDDEI